MTTKRDVLKEAASLYGNLRDHMAFRHPERAWKYEGMADYLHRLYKAKETGEKIAWINFATIPELFWAMDFLPVSTDYVSGTASFSPVGPAQFIDTAEQYVPDYICSTNKISFGAIVDGAIPVPDIVIYPSAPCDSAIVSYPLLCEYYKIPFFCIDVPYIRDERCYPYITHELKRLVSFLEEFTKERLDLDKLKQVMEYSNLAHKYSHNINQLLAAVPCPMPSIDILLDFNFTANFAGTAMGVDYLKKRYELTKEMVDNKKGHLENEKFRLLWVYAMPCFDWGVYTYLEQKYNAISICALNIFDHIPPEDISTEDKILRGLAEKLIAFPMLRECGGPWEYYINRLLEVCKRYKADAAIFGGHVACKHTWAIAQLIKERLSSELGIPTMIMEFDVFDPRICDADTIKLKFDNFFETHLLK